MTFHFTYKDEFIRDDLRQGDILKRTKELNSVLKEIYPHYLKPDYRYFIVLTQSCDLVRRKDHTCKAAYISLAAVRPFDTVLQSEALNIQKEEFERKASICRNNRKQKLESFVERVLNNNHPEFFYLHEENELELYEPCIGFLRLTIALRSKDYYEECLKAKFVELTDEFRAKLGWLSGNLYSRIGTKDWTPHYRTKEEFKRMINEILKRQFIWVDSNLAIAVKNHIQKNKIDISSMNVEDIYDLLETVHVPTKTEKKRDVLGSIERILIKSEADKTIDIKKLLLKIENDPIFKSHIK